MDCIILAGGTPSPDSPLYPLTKGQPKALLEINGRSMISYVLNAVRQVKQINFILIVGLNEDQFLVEDDNILQLPDQGSMVANGLAGFRWLNEHRQQAAHVLLCTVDTPLISSEMIESVITSSQPFTHALYYHFVSRGVMEKRFPDSKRTFVKLKGAEIAGADLMIVHPQVTQNRDALWEALTNGRKHAWKLARIVGPLFLLKFLLRQISIKEIEETASRILELPIKVNLTPFAELGMDVDKPAHLDIIQPYVE